MNRRTFVKTAIAVGAAASVVSRVRAQNDRKFKTALIGSGWWGTNILHEAMAAGRATVVALGDVDQSQSARTAADVEKLSGDKPVLYRDYRELLAKEKPEVVIVATPDHWHALTAIAALKSGAHIYLEKPICHTINEGKAIVKAAHDTGKVVQVGTHRRASPHNISARQFLLDGKAGQIGMVRAFVHYGGGAGGMNPDSAAPESLDWDFYCGPAQQIPFNRRIHPRGWRNYLNFSNGQIGDWGIHWLDQILWWSEEKAPRRVFSTMARHIKKDNGDAPDTQLATYEFENFTVDWEHRLYAANEAEKHSIGCYFYGTKGTLHLGWLDGWTFYPSSKSQPIIHEDPQLNSPDQQNIKELWADFLSAIDTGKQPISHIESGHRATTMALLAMISAKAGRSLNWNGATEEIIGDPQASSLMSRTYRAPWVYPSL